MTIDFHYGEIYFIARQGGLDPQAAEVAARACQYVDDATTRWLIKFAGGETFERFRLRPPALGAPIAGHRVGGHSRPRCDANANARLDDPSQAPHGGEQRIRGKLTRQPQKGRCVPRAVVSCRPWTGNRGSADPAGERRLKSVH